MNLNKDKLIMNFTESFDQFSSRVGPMDLALYAGAAIVLFVLFKDKLGPVNQLVNGVVSYVKGLVSKSGNSSVSNDTNGVFLDLVISWKKTRDLAVKAGCPEAVKVADQMFPFLSPNVCGKEETK